VSKLLAWRSVIERAAEIVRSYATSVTLRQLFYRLVSEQLIPNSETAYKRLSGLTAQARRAGTFPALIDRGRSIHRLETFSSPIEALGRLVDDWYCVDRTLGQDVSLYLGVEKAGLVVQLQAWFGAMGIPVVALGGYSSQTYVDDVVRHVRAASRPAILIYAGDFDPSGADIDRDFIARSDCWKDVLRIALNAAQVVEHRLPVNPGKATDSRAAGFIERHGELMQVELDALPPETLRGLYQAAIAAYWDTSAYEAQLGVERIDLADLRAARDWLKRRIARRARR